jgi:hypothetical protein
LVHVHDCFDDIQYSTLDTKVHIYARPSNTTHSEILLFSRQLIEHRHSIYVVKAGTILANCFKVFLFLTGLANICIWYMYTISCNI